MPDLPPAVAIDHLPEFLDGNHDVGSEGGGLPDLPPAVAIDHLPDFLGGNHEVGWLLLG